MLDLPLVGRVQERELLLKALEDARGGRGRAVLLSGDVGMGKSRLVEELVAHARTSDGSAFVGRSWEGVDRQPYWPWVQILRAAGSSSSDASITAAIKVALEAITLTDGEEDPSARSFEASGLVMEALQALSSSGPVVVVLEDLEHADESSAALLLFLSKTMRDSGVLFVGTFEPSFSRTSRVSETLEEISREQAQIVLAPLSEAEIAELYENVTGSEPSDGVLAGLSEASEGNPLFVIEATRSIERDEELRRPDHSKGFHVPSGIRDLIKRRIGALPQELQTLLSMAAVLGKTFEVAHLVKVADLDLEAVSNELSSEPARDVVQESSALGHFTFRHVLFRETLYEELSPANRMRLHRRCAEVIEEVDPRSHPELAHHWFKAAQAGDATRAMEHSLAAAKAFLASGATMDAERLLQRALRAAAMARADARTVGRIEMMLDGLEDESQQPAENRAVFKQEGDYWVLRFDGAETRLKDRKGLRYLARLLANPGTEIHAQELASEGGLRGERAGVGELSADVADGFAALDEDAKRAYKQRLADLRVEQEEAESYNDPERAARLGEEISALTHELAAAVGLGGRDRKTNSPSERARVSVTKALKDAMKRIETHLPALGSHLNLTVRTGTFCSYSPDPRVPMEWEL